MPAGTLTIRDFEGVNLEDDPQRIDDAELVWSKNFYAREPGIIARSPIPASQLESKLLPNGNQPTAATFVGGEFVSNGGVIEWTAAPALDPFGVPSIAFLWGGSVSSVTFVASAFWTAPPVVLAYGERLWLAGPGARPLCFELISGTVTEVALSDVPDDVTSVGVYRDQVVFSRGSTVIPLRVNDSEALGPNRRGFAEEQQFTVGAGDGDDIRGFLEVPIVGGSDAIASYLLVFKSGSVYIISGELPLGDDTDDTDVGTFTVVPLLPEAGCPHIATVASNDDGVFFASADNVWWIPSGQRPVRVGDKIGPLLASKGPGLWNEWHAVVDGDYYKLSVPGDKPSWSASSAEQWWMDIRPLPKKAPNWWGPQLIQTEGMFRSVGGGVRALMAIPKWYSAAQTAEPEPADMTWTGSYTIGGGGVVTMQPGAKASYAVPCTEGVPRVVRFRIKHSVAGSASSLNGVLTVTSSADVVRLYSANDTLSAFASTRNVVSVDITRQDTYDEVAIAYASEWITGTRTVELFAVTSSPVDIQGIFNGAYRMLLAADGTYHPATCPSENPGWRHDANSNSFDVVPELRMKAFDFGDESIQKIVDDIHVVAQFQATTATILEMVRDRGGQAVLTWSKSTSRSPVLTESGATALTLGSSRLTSEASVVNIPTSSPRTLAYVLQPTLKFSTGGDVQVRQVTIRARPVRRRPS